jgi:hypothetical protein
MNIPSALLNINISILMDLITPRQSGQLILVHYVIPNISKSIPLLLNELNASPGVFTMARPSS